MKTRRLNQILLFCLVAVSLTVMSCQKSEQVGATPILVDEEAEIETREFDPFATSTGIDPISGLPNVFTDNFNNTDPLNPIFTGSIDATGTPSAQNPVVGVTPGGDVGQPQVVQPQTAVIGLVVPVGGTYDIWVPGVAKQSCSADCTVVVNVGDVVRVRAVPSTTPLLSQLSQIAEIKHNAWGWSCEGTAAGEDCNLTIDGNKAVAAQMIEEVDFRFAQFSSTNTQQRIQAALRNSSFLYHNGLWARAGWANEGCWQDGRETVCAATGITPDAASVAQFCSVVGTGFFPDNVTTAKPTWTGWANSGQSSRGFHNLRIASFNGFQWNNLCDDGRNCYDEQHSYVTRLTCGRTL